MANIYCSEQELKDEIIKLQKVEELKELLETDPDSPRVKELQDEGIDPTYRKTNFGKMVLDIVMHLSTKSNFGGYTESWKTDMISNAIEKIMLYTIKNFDATLISKISGEPVKAFAYVTQIAHNAFIETIKKLKREQDTINELISYEDLTNVKVKHLGREKNTHIIEDLKYDYIIAVGKTDENGEYKVMLGRNKNITLDASYPDNTFFVMDSMKNIITTGEFKDIASLVESYKNNITQIIYPQDYTISLDEYEKIKAVNADTINISKYDNTYVPSFPKRTKQEKEDCFLDWLD